MKFLALIVIFYCLVNGTKFHVQSVRWNNGLDLDLPIDENGNGRLKVQINNLNIAKSSKLFLKVTGSLFLLSLPVFTIPGTFFWSTVFVCNHRVHFPMMGAKTQVPDSNKKGWKSQSRDKALHAFEYHHRGISGSKKMQSWDTNLWGIINGYERDHEEIYRDACKRELEFIFDFRDQAPKYFTKLELKVPTKWSGYELVWSLSEDTESKIKISNDMPNEPFNQINLISFLGTKPKKFYLYAKFTQKKYQRRAVDIDLLTLEYQLLNSKLNYNEYELILKDGTIFLSKEFIKAMTPSIEMLFRNQEKQSNTLELKASPLSVTHFKFLKELTNLSFVECKTLLADYSVEELIDLLLLLDYLLVPRDYVKKVFRVLYDRANLTNGCLIMNKFPKVGIMAEFRKELNLKFKNLFVEEMKSEEVEIFEFCESIMNRERKE